MKAVCELNKEEYDKLSKVTVNLHNKTTGMSRSDMFKTFERHSGYAHYTFSGTISENLINKLGRMPTPDEIIILVDSGFSHFGAACSITDTAFTGYVNTD